MSSIPHPLLLVVGIALISVTPGADRAWWIGLLIDFLGASSIVWWHHQLERSLRVRVPAQDLIDGLAAEVRSRRRKEQGSG